MTRERLEEIKGSFKVRNCDLDPGTMAECLNALDALLPPPEIKVGDVVVPGVNYLMMFRVGAIRGGNVYPCGYEEGPGQEYWLHCRLATPAERAIFEEWEREKGWGREK